MPDTGGLPLLEPRPGERAAAGGSARGRALAASKSLLSLARFTMSKRVFNARTHRARRVVDTPY